MPNMLAMSFEGVLAPSFTLHCLDAGRTLPYGWGLGYYPAGEPSVGVPMWVGKLAPPYERTGFGDQDLDVDLTRRGAKSRKGVTVCTERLVPQLGDAARAMTWRQLAPGDLLVIREGAVIAERSTGGVLVTQRTQRLPSRAEARRYDVVHRTTYRYEVPIERSQHILRLNGILTQTEHVRVAVGRNYLDAPPRAERFSSAAQVRPCRSMSK